jgi:hypothetical protein
MFSRSNVVPWRKDKFHFLASTLLGFLNYLPFEIDMPPTIAQGKLVMRNSKISDNGRKTISSKANVW